MATFLVRWLETVSSRVKPKTMEGYSNAVNKLIVPIIGGIKLQTLEPHHVATMVARV